MSHLGQQLFICKLDTERMFATVSYEYLHSTLVMSGVPHAWCNVFMSEVKGKALHLQTVRRVLIIIFMHQGLIEGSPISIVAIAIMLTRVITNVCATRDFASHAAQREADRIQRGVPLPPNGWLDEWLLLAHPWNVWP